MPPTAVANPYLDGLIKDRESILTNIQNLQTRAKTDGRDLSDDEKATLANLRERGLKLNAEIKTLAEPAIVDADVDQMIAKLRTARARTSPEGDGEGDEDAGDDDTAGDPAPGATGRRTGGAKTRQRETGHYRSTQQGGRFSFFGDIYKAQHGDQKAKTRLDEHMRSLDTAGEGAGVIPPKWLAELYEDLPRQGRALSSAVRNIPLGDDPRPMQIPKQTAGVTSGSGLTVDQAEVTNSTPNTSYTDAWDSDVATVTPLATTAGQIVTRQLLDMGNPAVDLLIYGDMQEAYNDAVETKVCNLVNSIGTALSALGGSDVTDPTHYDTIALDAAMQVRQNRKRPPDVYAMNNIRYGRILGLRDSIGRPLVPAAGDGGAVNVSGVGTVAVDGRWHGMGIIATAGFAQDDRFYAVRLADILLFESNMMRFRYEQPLGPDLVKLGIWAYTATHARYGTKAVKAVEIEEAS